MEEDPENTDDVTVRDEVQEYKGEPDKHFLKLERKKKMKKLKEENKRLKNLLKEIDGKVSKSGHLIIDQQSTLAEEIRREITCIPDDDTNHNNALNGKASNESTLKHLEDETSFSPNFVSSPTNLNGNSGFEFGHSQPSDVSSSVKQNRGRNYFLRDVVENPQVTDYLNFGASELNLFRQQVCLKNEDFTPISPLPPTPPPKNNDPKTTEPQKAVDPLNNNRSKQSFESSSSKRLSFNHQQSEGFDISPDQPISTDLFGVNDSLSVASNVPNTRLGKYEFASRRSADGGVLLTFSLSDNISFNVDSNTWQITCHIPDPKRKLPECTPVKSVLPSQNVDCISNSLEVHESVPCKKQRLSTDESPRVAELGSLNQMNNIESNSSQGISNLVHAKDSDLNALSTQSKNNVQSKQEQISDDLSFVNYNNENKFQAAENNKSVVSSSSESASPLKVRCSSIVGGDSLPLVQGLFSHCSVAKADETHITKPNIPLLNDEASTFKNSPVVTRSQISEEVSISKSVNSKKRAPLKKHSSKKLSKRKTPFSKGNPSAPALLKEQPEVDGTESFGDINGYLLASCSKAVASVLRTPKHAFKKQRLISGSSDEAVHSACKSPKAMEQDVKADKYLESGTADSFGNCEEFNIEMKGHLAAEVECNVSRKTTLNQINVQNSEQTEKNTAEVTKQKDVVSGPEGEQNLMEPCLQNNIKISKSGVEIHDENSHEIMVLENGLSCNQDAKQNDDLSSFNFPNSLSITKCENFKPKDVKCDVSHKDEVSTNSDSKLVNDSSEGSVPHKLTHSTLKVENDSVGSFEESNISVTYNEFECNIKSSNKCNSNPFSDLSSTDNTTSNMHSTNNFKSPSKDIKSTLCELVSPNSKISKKFSSPENKLYNVSKQDSPKENSKETHFNQIELGSFDPDAFTKPNVIDEMGLIKTVPKTEMQSSTTSKNMLEDNIFSVFNSGKSLKTTLKRQDEVKKESPEFSFLNSTVFPFECLSLPIKKRILPEVKQSESACNNGIAPSTPEKSQTYGSEKGGTPSKASATENNQIPIKDELNAGSSDSNYPGFVVSEAEIEVKSEFKKSTKKLPGYILDHADEKEAVDSPEKVLNGSTSKKETVDSPEKVRNGSTSKSIYKSFNSGCMNSCEETEESDHEHALVIADDSVDSDHAAEPETNNSEDFPSTGIKETNNVSPKKRCGRQFKTQKKKCDVILTGVEVAFKTLEKMKYNDLHLKHNTHNLYSAFINPDNSPISIVYLILKNLSTSKRNPMLSYFMNQDPSLLLPLPEKCIVTALFKASAKPRLVQLLPSIVVTINNIVLSKQNIHIYGLCSLCRVLTEICKLQKEKKVPIILCVDLVSSQHRFASYIVASIIGVWRDLFTVSEKSPDEDRVLFGLLALAVNKKTKTLTQSQWNHCHLILSETLTEILQPDLSYTIEFIKKRMDLKCSKGMFANTYRLTSSLVIIARIQDWQSTKELILDSFVIPNLEKYCSEEMNQKAFTLFCFLYGNICTSCPNPEEPHDYLKNLFYNTVDTFAKETVAVAFIKLCLERKDIFPEFLQGWLEENSTNPKLETLKDCFQRSLLSTDELSESDVRICE